MTCNDQEIIGEEGLPGSFQSMQQMNFSRSYPNPDIPEAAFFHAYQQQEKMRKAKSQRAGAEPWEAKGPLNTAGRCLSIAINPQEERTIYAGTASGGLWRSRDLGLGVSWERINTGFPVLGVSDIEFALGDSTVMFIGTGEVYNNISTGTDGAYRPTRGSYGIGILKSTDGGKTWIKSLDWTYQNNRGVWMIKIDPIDDQIVYAATTEGIYKSIDQGDSWTKTFPIRMATDIEINPNNTNEIIASFGNLFSPGKGIYKSFDAGENWQKITGTLVDNFGGKIQLAYAPSQPEIVYATMGNGLSANTGASWLYRSENFGDTWELLSTVDFTKWQGWFSHDVSVNPMDPNDAVVIGVDAFKYNHLTRQLEEKSNGGVALGTPGIGEPDGNAMYSHSDHHIALFHPSIPDLVLLGNDGGVFHYNNATNQFRSATGGMQTTQFYNGFSVAQDDPEKVMGGLQDNSTVIYSGTGAWSRNVGGDGSWSAINYDDSQTLFASYQNLNILKSVNGGANFDWVNLAKPNDEVPLFIAPYVIAPANSEIMYAGGKYFYKSFDRGSSFFPANNGIKVSDNPIYCMDVSWSDPNVVYMGTGPYPIGTPEEPQVFISVDGVTVNPVDFDFPNRIINDVTVDPSDHNIAYICLSGFGSSHLFKTRDMGENWIAIDNGLPDVPGNAIMVNPFNTQQLYYGNDIGVYISEDGGTNWETWDAGLPNACIVMDLKISPIDRHIWVATHGSGAYKRALEGEVVSSEPVQENLALKLVPNPTNDFIRIIDNESKLKDLRFELFDLQGKLIRKGTLTNNEINVAELKNGNYVLRVNGEKEIYVGRFLKVN